ALAGARGRERAQALAVHGLGDEADGACVRKAPKVLTIFLWSSARTRSISSASLGRIAGLSRSLRRTRRDTGRLSFLSTARYVSPNGPRENGPSTSYLPSRTVPDESAGGGADTDPHLRPRLSGRSMSGGARFVS